jgi:chromosome segregation ATPase
MTKAALQEKNDMLGLFALGSAIANLAQGTAYVDLNKAHGQLLAQFQHLVQRYNQMWREYQTLRSTNQELQRQSREYQHIVDELRKEVSELQRKLAQKEGPK